MGQVMIGGRRRAFYGRTSTEVQRKIREAKEQANVGSGDQPAPSVAEYLADWVASRYRQVDRREIELSTFDGDERTVRLYLSPVLGRHRLRELTAAHVDAMLDAIRAQGGGELSQSSRWQIRRILGHALHDAEARELVDRNAARLSRPIKKRQVEVEPFSLSEARRIVAAAVDHDAGAIFLAATLLGMRQGEVLGLRWENVDLKNAVIHVRTHLKREKDRDGVVRFVLGDLKTHLKARRSLQVPPELVEVLSLQRHRQYEMRARVGDSWCNRLGLVFTTELGTPIERTNFIRRRWRPFLRTVGVPYRKFHTTRHTVATVADAAGLDTTAISRILGHANERTTADIYKHAFAKVVPTQAVADVLFAKSSPEDEEDFVFPQASRRAANFTNKPR
ncbi:MAG TPA: site-specific integrase [Candidatus Dormibacteraeota bacterium]|nr:site-specific integrase [Candidatus Dormibacteraeota bacterium]